jgi:NADH:ubiquinone oxidoreductase subunit F (NADH-binding)
MGTPLSAVVNTLGQGFRKDIKALHIGGPLGGLSACKSKIQRIVTIDFESFNEAGFLLRTCFGSKYSKVEFPIVKYIEHLFAFTAHESCGKCFSVSE